MRTSRELLAIFALAALLNHAAAGRDVPQRGEGNGNGNGACPLTQFPIDNSENRGCGAGLEPAPTSTREHPVCAVRIGFEELWSSTCSGSWCASGALMWPSSPQACSNCATPGEADLAARGKLYKNLFWQNAYLNRKAGPDGRSGDVSTAMVAMATGDMVVLSGGPPLIFTTGSADTRFDLLQFDLGFFTFNTGANPSFDVTVTGYVGGPTGTAKAPVAVTGVAANTKRTVTLSGDSLRGVDTVVISGSVPYILIDEIWVAPRAGWWGN